MICHTNHRDEVSEVSEEKDTKNCERCGGPVNTDKRFCRRYMDGMGAPAYDEAFNGHQNKGS